MSVRLFLALAVLALDLWAIERLWRPTAPHHGRLRWTAAIVLLPVLGVVLAHRRGAPPVTAAVPDPKPTVTDAQ